MLGLARLGVLGAAMLFVAACGGETSSSGKGTGGAGGGGSDGGGAGGSGGSTSGGMGGAAASGGTGGVGGGTGGLGGQGGVAVGGTGGGDAGPLCTAVAGSANVTGTFPAGALSSTYSLFYRVYGECGDNLTILILPSASLPSSDPTTWPLPVVTLHVVDQVGSGLQAQVELSVGSTVYATNGSVDLTAKSPAPVGSFVAKGNGLDLAGSFAPSYCPDLDVLCP